MMFLCNICGVPSKHRKHSCADSNGSRHCSSCPLRFVSSNACNRHYVNVHLPSNPVTLNSPKITSSATPASPTAPLTAHSISTPTTPALQSTPATVVVVTTSSSQISPSTAPPKTISEPITTAVKSLTAASSASGKTTPAPPAAHIKTTAPKDPPHELSFLRNFYEDFQWEEN